MKGREFKRVWGFPWDYSYLLGIERRKLQEMANYFKKSRLTEGWERQVKDCELCVKLIDIVLERDSDYKAWSNASFGNHDKAVMGPVKFHKHINMKNARRFVPNLDLTDVNDRVYKILEVEIRKMKALHLYNKIRSYRMYTWWD